MAWIESHQELRGHPKLTKLSGILKGDPAHLTGHLHWLWWWCMDYAMDGDLGRYDEAQIAAAAGWHGEPSEFCLALHDSGFIEKVHGKYRIHDWFDFCGEIIRKRLERKEARRKTAENGRQWPPKSAEMPPTVPDPTVPNLTVPNPTEPINTLAQAPKRENSPLPSKAFETIWAQYPRKKGRDAAERHFKAQVKTMKDWLDINNSLAHFKEQLRKDRTEEKYIPHGSTWFNGRWHDTVAYEEGPTGGARDINEFEMHVRKLHGLPIPGQETTNAPNGSASSDSDKSIRKWSGKTTGLRKADFQGPAGALLGRIRDRPVPESAAEKSDGRPDPSNGKPVV